MGEYSSGAYIIPRKPRGGRNNGRRGRGGGGRRGAGILILSLLILTAVVCALVVILPRVGTTAASSDSIAKERKFFFLAVSDTSDRVTANESSQITQARGGAGYVYNDGKYRIIAAVYKRETDANALAAVNDGAHVIAVAVPPLSLSPDDVRALDYLFGEWFDGVCTASAELDRGNITEAAADYAAAKACRKLISYADEADSAALSRTLFQAGEYAVPNGCSVLSYLRFIAVRAVALFAQR